MASALEGLVNSLLRVMDYRCLQKRFGKMRMGHADARRVKFGECCGDYRDNMNKVRFRLKVTSGLGNSTLRMSCEQIRLQVRPKLFGVNCWIPPMIS